MTAVERFLPAWEFRERHEIVVRAPAARVDHAIRSVTLAELPAARVLLALRAFPNRLGGRKPRSGNPRAPLFDVITRGGASVVLADEPGKEVALGLTGQFARLVGAREPAPRTPAEFLAYDRPDSCKAVMDFRIEPRGADLCVLSTETRVHAGPQARRKFARYWRVIRPFSGLIRILFLRAARRRAEGRR